MKQIIFASATVTNEMRRLANDYFGEGMPGGGYQELIEKSTHMNLSHLNHEFIHISDFDKIKPL